LELAAVETELATYSDEEQRFDVLADVCTSLNKLQELRAEDLFWEGIAADTEAVTHIERAQNRVDCFKSEMQSIHQRKERLEKQIDDRLEALGFLSEDVRDAYDREDRRNDEFIVDRDISKIPYRPTIMPWSKESESGGQLRRAALIAMLACFILGALVPLIKVPVPDRSVAVVEIPKRIAKLVKKRAVAPEPVSRPAEKKPVEEPKKLEKDPEKQPKKTEVAKKSEKPEKKAKAAAMDSGAETLKARKRAESVGVLAFKSAFADLAPRVPAVRLGTEARIRDESIQVAGRALALRSIVAIRAPTGSSGGIGVSDISRGVGNGNVDRLTGGGGNGDGSSGFLQVNSTIADLEESERPLSDSLAPGRTDEEIQIVFDRYKASLYRIYNRELRKDPTLLGKILLQIIIEADGSVSGCEAVSTDLGSPELVAKVVERIKRFNFGPKEGVPKITILYPIDFLPGLQTRAAG